MRPDLEQKRRSIIIAIKKNGPRAIFELVRDTGYDKKTVIKYCSGLKLEGIIQRNGKFGKYYLTDNAYEYPALKGGIFQMVAMREIFWPSRTKNCFPKHSKFYQNQLSDFVYNIGTFITYSLILSMAPNAWDPKINKNSETEIIQGIGKDTAIKQWLNGCISPSQILFEFSNLDIIKNGLPWSVGITPPSLNDFLKRFDSKYANLSSKERRELKRNAKNAWVELNKEYNKNRKRYFNPLDPFQSRFVLNEETYNEIVKAFKQLYPDVHNKLGKIWGELDNEIKQQIELSNRQKTY